jgi:adenylate kinase family enzyme
VEDDNEIDDGKAIEREECALPSGDVISFVHYIVPSTSDGLIGPEEFVRAFRRHRRERVMSQAAQEARLILRRVRYAIEAKEIRLEQWIRMMGEGTIIGDLRRFTLMHLTAGLRHLSEKGPGTRFSRNDAVVIIRYIENEQGEGYFTKDTLLQALESTGSDEEQEETKQRIFEQFEFYLKAKNLDVRRMSYVLGLTNENKVEPEQLIRTLEGIMSAGGNPLVAQEQKSKVLKVAQISESEAQQQLRIRHELFNQLEQTEALGSFRKTIALLHKRGRRPHALLESLDEKMMRRGKTVTTVTRAELIEVLRQSTQPLNQARRFLRKGAKDAGTNPIKESNDYVERMTELTQSGVAKVATSLDDYIRRAPGGFEGVFLFVGPKRSDEESSRDSKALASSSWRMSPDELDLALKQLKLKLTKSDTRKLIDCLARSESGSTTKKKKKKKYIYLQDLQVLLKDVRKWKWLQEQEKRPLFSSRELQLVLNYICPEIDISVREIKLVLQQCKNKKQKVEREVELRPPTPRPETPISNGPIEVIFLIGGPSSGKTTQSKLLAEDLGYTFLAQRRDIAEDTESAVRHRYVPPEVICHLLREQIKSSVLESGSKGFVIEGFPSDRKSAAAWAALNRDIAVVRGVVVLDCAIDLMVARCKTRNILPAKINERIRNWRIHTEQELTAIGNFFPTDVITADSGVDAVAAAILAAFKEPEEEEEKQEEDDLQSRLLSMTNRPGTAPVSLDGTANMSETNDLKRRLVEKDAELFMLRKMLEEKEAHEQQQTAVDQYSIRMRIIAASNLLDLGDDCRPYCSLEIVKMTTGEPIENLQKFRSKQIDSTLRSHRLNPVWNEQDYICWEVPKLDVAISIKLFGGNKFDGELTQKHQPIGGAMIPASQGKEDKWFFLSSIDEMDRQATGSVHVHVICSKIELEQQDGQR